MQLMTKTNDFIHTQVGRNSQTDQAGRMSTCEMFSESVAITMDVHHSRRGTILRRGHFRAVLVVLAFLFVFVLLQTEQNTSPCEFLGYQVPA